MNIISAHARSFTTYSTLHKLVIDPNRAKYNLSIIVLSDGSSVSVPSREMRRRSFETAVRLCLLLMLLVGAIAQGMYHSCITLSASLLHFSFSRRLPSELYRATHHIRGLRLIQSR